MSFTRKQYEQVFRFALRVYNDADSESLLEQEAVLTMWMVEDVIGQHEDFPDSARDNYPRQFFRSALPTITNKETSRAKRN